jgi:hypothetical protein
MPVKFIEPLVPRSGRKMRPKQWCEKYQQSPQTLYRLIRAGKITARKLGASTLIDEAESDAYFESLPMVGKRGQPCNRATERKIDGIERRSYGAPLTVGPSVLILGADRDGENSKAPESKVMKWI